MTGKSKVCFRWEIDREKLLDHEYVMDSVVFKEAGFEWKASIRPFGSRSNGSKSFFLSCKSDRRDWKCAANVELLIHRATGKPYSEVRPSTFTHEQKQCGFHNFELGYFTIGSKYRVEFIIEIMKAQGADYIGQRPIDLAQFYSAHEKDNVTLIIESKKVRVSKKFLTADSPYFSAIFFGDFAEKEKEEVEIKDVVYEEFLDLLQALSPVQAQITGSTILHVLALGDRFGMKKVIELMERNL
ncbi:hypothetical protein PMAYCL1PPCAC_25558, partial [Pristionchus mayeri]